MPRLDTAAAVAQAVGFSLDRLAGLSANDATATSEADSETGHIDLLMETITDVLVVVKLDGIVLPASEISEAIAFLYEDAVREGYHLRESPTTRHHRIRTVIRYGAARSAKKDS